jgi:hypothetical protein
MARRLWRAIKAISKVLEWFRPAYVPIVHDFSLTPWRANKAIFKVLECFRSEAMLRKRRA